MNKTTLIETLTKGLCTEESSIRIYTNHITQAVSRGNLTDKECAAINRVFTELKNESLKHKKIVSTLIEEIKKDPRDDI